jgi:hypothetical protein
MKLDYNKCITNVKAFLPNDKEIIKIIKLCRLEPLNNNWRIWTDNSGNLLTISKNRKIHSRKTDDYSLKADDLYLKASAKDIAKISRWAMISIGDNDCLLWFLGVDDRLRHVSYMSGLWTENKPPLSSGIGSLKTIVQYIDIETVVGETQWAATLPLSNNIIEKILLTNVGETIIKEITQ